MHMLKEFTGSVKFEEACGKQFVTDVTCPFNGFTTECGLEAIALKATMTLPSLMLQRPHAKSKTHDHISCLWCRSSLWEENDISNFLTEGRALQKSLARSQLPTGDTADQALTVRRFQGDDGGEGERYSEALV